jgi:hypothetical protein
VIPFLFELFGPQKMQKGNRMIKKKDLIMSASSLRTNLKKLKNFCKAMALT